MRANVNLAGVVLAAGRSRRFGSAKQLAMLEGRTLLEHALDAALRAGLRPVVGVVPVWLTRPAGSDPALAWVRNAHPELGISHSLRIGLAAVPRECEGAVVMLGDQPSVPVAHLRALVSASGPLPIVATEVDGLLQPPILIHRSAFALADALNGDVGLRDLLRGENAPVTSVALDAPHPDIDTPADLDRAHRIGHMFDSSEEGESR